MDKRQIETLLMTNDLAVARALVALTDRQTADEQSSEATRYHNGRGFRPCHARMGTSMAKFYKSRGYLSPKQIAYWRAPQRDGRPRIAIYSGQLAEIAAARATAKSVTPQNPHVGCDPGNLAEERMILQEQLHSMQIEYGMYMDSEDEGGLAAMKAEIDEFIRRINLIDEAMRHCA